MQKAEIEKTYTNICKLVHKNRLADALVLLKRLVTESGKEYIREEVESLQQTYTQLLKHSFSSVEDPERDNIYIYLKRSLLELADEIREMLLMVSGAGNALQLKRNLLQDMKPERAEALQLLEHLTFDDELAGLLKEVKVDDAGAGEHREVLFKIFSIIWLTDKYAEEENKLLEAACDTNNLPWYHKALIVSALTQSLLRYFEINKFLLLFRFVEKQQEFVWERALIGLFAGFLKYNDRYLLYPVLQQKTKSLLSVTNIELHLEAIVIQFAKSRETEKVKKKWEEDILPEMMKMRPNIEKKLDLDNVLPDIPEEEKNPEWETVFEDAPDLLNKLQELTEMQMDGMDVFISAFSQLKHFPFFREIGNWFVPFYKEHPGIRQAIDTTVDGPNLYPLVEKLENTYFMCNSDKYSFCLNLALIPEQQKGMMMNVLNAEMENISELEKDEGMLNNMARSRSIYTQYFQDLYRFYKLHPWRREFDDVFAMDVNPYETHFVNELVQDGKTIRNIAELLFDKRFYHDALKIFLSIIEKDQSNIELFEKVAFCYEKTGDMDQAFLYYQKADLIETDRPWIIKKLAFCSKYLNRWDDALKYYLQAEKHDPEDMRVQANVGQCLIHLDRYREALDCYFKVEVLAPENAKIRRPLAWCSFLLGKFDVARDYLERLLTDDPNNYHDLINLGHVLWCRKDAKAAFMKYKKSILACKSIKDFEVSFNDDRMHLESHGIKPADMDLMLDYLKLEIRSKQQYEK